MEESCTTFQEAEEKLGPKFVNHSMNHGYSYLLVNLQQQKGCLEQNAAGSMIDFLMAVKFDAYSPERIEFQTCGALRRVLLCG